jgi:Zn2+/Cd2+-exporting ATPase
MSNFSMNVPYLFDEFFSSGREESISPFLTHNSRNWGKNLSLKTSFLAATCLLFAFAFSFTHIPIANVFLACVFFLSGTPALIASINDLRNFEINIDVLMTIAAFLAVLIGSSLEGALLLVLFEMSGALEHAVSHKALSALHNLNHLAPKFALVVGNNGALYEKSVREIEAGMRLFVKAGEIVPLDGRVVEGVSSVNLVHLTGESVPNVKKVGDAIPAGARNLDAALTIEVTHTSADSTLMRIIKLITEAHEAKPRLQRVLDRFGKKYASTVIALTLFFAIALPWFFSMEYLGAEGSIYRALSFLIAASPCALILATPTAYLSAISACARKGIILKGGTVLDALASCTIIAFDKTGTLTTGELLCTAIEPVGQVDTAISEALSIAAALERHVVHPIASAITRLATEQRVPLIELAAVKTIPGYGLEGIYQNTPVAIGLLEYIAKKVPEASSLLDQIRSVKDAPGQVLSALMIGEELFLFRFTDRIRQAVPQLMESLKHQHNLRPVMLTGDHEQNARAIGAQLHIPEIFANLRPEDKLQKIGELLEEGPLAMVGDGINDAPALTRATVGISLGRIGSATAVEASDVVLLNDDLDLLEWLFHKSRRTRRVVKQNLMLSLGVIAFASMPALLGLVPLWLAVLLHEGGTLLVGCNSLRLLRSRA